MPPTPKPSSAPARKLGDEPLARRPRREPPGLARASPGCRARSPWPRQASSASRATQDLGGPPQQRRLEQRRRPRRAALPIQKSPVDTSTRATPSAPGARWSGQEEVVGGAVQELGVGDRARRDHADDLAPHELLAPWPGASICSHTATFWPGADEAARCSRRRRGAGCPPSGSPPSPFCREVSVIWSRRDAGVGVLEEQLVEVAEAEEQQVVRVAPLQLPVLPHHRGQLGRRVSVTSRARRPAGRRWRRAPRGARVVSPTTGMKLVSPSHRGTTCTWR